MSKLFSVNRSDFFKSLIMAVLVPVALVIQQSVDAGIFLFNWKQIGMSAVAGALGFLVKKFASNSEDKILKRDEK